MERDRCNQRRPALLPRWDLPTYKRGICCDWSLRGQVSIAYLGSQVFKEGDRTLPLPLPIMVHPFLSLASALTSRFLSSSQTLDPNQSFLSLPPHSIQHHPHHTTVPTASIFIRHVVRLSESTVKGKASPYRMQARFPTPQPTPYQARVYSLLRQIPPGRLTTYAALARALNSSPRAGMSGPIIQSHNPMNVSC